MARRGAELIGIDESGLKTCKNLGLDGGDGSREGLLELDTPASVVTGDSSFDDLTIVVDDTDNLCATAPNLLNTVLFPSLW